MFELLNLDAIYKDIRFKDKRKRIATYQKELTTKH